MLELKASVLAQSEKALSVPMENVIHIRRYKFLQKLLRVTSWVNRLITDSKGKLLNNEILLNSFITIYNQ